DNGATTQKPVPVLETIQQFYMKKNASIHRGVHFLSEEATDWYERARKKVQQYIHARYSQEIIFTSGTTGSINAVAFSFGECYIQPDDEIIISGLEHHSNIVPWQMMCDRKKARLKVIPITDSGEINMDVYKNLLSPK